MKQKITTRLLATLLLAVGSLAAIPLTTVLTGCAEEELFDPTPAETANPELKPGEIAIHLNVPPLTGFGEAGTRTPGSGTGDYDPGKTSWAVGDELMVKLGIQGEESGGYTTFTYTIFTTAICTQAGDGGTPAQWQLSATPQKIYRSATDEQSGVYVLMPPTFNPFGEQGQFILPAELERCTAISVSAMFSYAPGTRWVTESNWSEIATDLSLPTAATTGTLERWSLKNVLFNTANGLQPIGAADTAAEAASKRNANATKLAALFTLDLSKGDGGNAFVPDACGRLRIATFPGATVQIASKKFIPTAAKRTYNASSQKFVADAVTGADGTTAAVTATGDATYLNLDGNTAITVGNTPGTADENDAAQLIPADLPIYTTTADALGNAYFYGELNDGSDGDLDGTTGKEFIVSVSVPATGSTTAPATPAAEGAKQVIFRATKKAPVKLASGGSVKIDGNTVNTDKIYAVNVSECTNAADLTTKLVAAHTAGKTIWTVTGKASDKWSGSSSISSDAAITKAISGALNTIHGTNPNARISLYLPTITTIASQAFEVRADKTNYGGLLLQSITAPEATGNIGTYAFNGCTALTTAHLPKATTIGNSAFNGCTALTTAHLPVATTIAGSAFNGCKALTTAHLPGVTSIGTSAFNGCKALTTVHLPAATSIGNNAFYDCTALTTVHLPVATSIGYNAFSGCKALTTAHLPAATSISDDAFYGCTSLTTLRFGTSPITTCGSQILGYIATKNITLTLANGQKDFKQDGTATETPVEFGTGKSFAGYTFKEIRQAK